jgi:hypothetical protein
VAHGIFPIVENPEYCWEEEGERESSIQLLLHSCRLGALFMQLLIGKYNNGFESDRYDYMSDGLESEPFISNCTIGYISKLHIEGEFSFSGVLG